MNILDNPDSRVSEIKEHHCDFHQKYPGIRLGWDCTCSISFSNRQATPEEQEQNRIRREKEESERSNALSEFGYFSHLTSVPKR